MVVPIGLAELIKSDVVTVNHLVFDEETAHYEDPDTLLKLIQASMDEYKANNGIEQIKSTRADIRKEFINPAVKSWNAANKARIKANDIASKLFGDIVTCKKARVDGVPKDICLY